jgi:hypothetical protein
MWNPSDGASRAHGDFRNQTECGLSVRLFERAGHIDKRPIQ